MKVAQILLTLAVLAYAVAPPFADFNSTHALHPDWTGHARFHMVWLVVTNSLIGFFALYQIWFNTAQRGLVIGAVLSTLVLGGFFIAALAMPIYDGALHDHGGVTPAPGGLDRNLSLFGVALILNFAGLAWARITN